MAVIRQVKIFQSSEITIEEKINKWLEENGDVDIVDIKIAGAGNGATSLRETYMIIYKKNKV